MLKTVLSVLSRSLRTYQILFDRTLLTQGIRKTSSGTKLSITATGYSLLNDAPLAPDTAQSSAKFFMHSTLKANPLESYFTLTLPAHTLPQPENLMTILEISTLQPPAKEQLTLSLQATSFIAALHRGWSPPALKQAVLKGLNRPFTPQESTVLKQWAKAAQRMTLHYALLLETTNPAVITQLASTRRGRALIQGTLSPRAVKIDPTKVSQIVKRLTAQEGVPPQADLAQVKNRSTQPSIDNLPVASLWLAVQVYQQLGQHISLPMRISQTVLDQLIDLASPADLAAAESLAQQTIATINQVIDGRAAFSPWSEEGLPEEESLAIIKQALANGQNIQLLYYAASTDRLTRRVVEPYRVEGASFEIELGVGEKDDGGEGFEPKPKKQLKPKTQTPYLVGFCHHAQAERTFRLDRIRALEVVEG